MIDKSEERGYSGALRSLRRRLSEHAPSRIQLLVGPRQVGKTTLLLELQKDLAGRAVYASADAPEAALPNWRDGVWRSVEELAQGGQAAVLLLDEVQYLPDWSRWLKARFDRVLRDKMPIHIVATGSSALHVGAGSRETMAGRFEKTLLTHWCAADLGALAGIPRDLAAERFVTHGAYPGAVGLWDEPVRWRSYLRDSIIEPAIGRDILSLEKVRKPALLRQVFALAAAHPAEILSLDKMAGALAEKGALETISHYLELLAEAFLVKPLQKYSGAELRRRKSPPKLVVMNNALLAGTGTLPSREADPARWGRWLENACLAHAINQGNEVYYWREEPWEVYAVMIGQHARRLVEVKSARFTAEDLRGLAHAAGRFPEFKPLVVCDPGEERQAQAAGFEAMSWVDFLADC
jgi:uncharacterized protein